MNDPTAPSPADRVTRIPNRDGGVRVTLFITCLADTLFPAVGKATVRLLERLGCEVDFLAQQTCCGQMHLNTGYARAAAALAARFAAVFAGAEMVVTPSGSCAAMVREQYPRLGVYEIPPVFELSEFLVHQLGVEDVGAHYPHSVTYHPTCHSLRSLRVGDAPLRLLRQVRGIDLVELPDAEVCCGFGGTFAVKQVDTSAAMLVDKVRCVLDTSSEVVTAGDSSCLMQIGGALTRQRAGVRAVHLAEILAQTEAESAL
jgi:L-lactate dehydrogenase complex protein LldE